MRIVVCILINETRRIIKGRNTENWKLNISLIWGDALIEPDNQIVQLS